MLGYALIQGRKFRTSVSVATIYSYIKKGVFLHITQEELPRHGKKKQGYKKVKTKKDQARASAGESIENRPEEVVERKVFGHWEMDTVYSRKSTTTKALLVLTERKTRQEIIVLIPNRKAETIVKALDALERKFGAVNFRKIFRSITVDNGSEFAAAEELERSAVNKTIPRTKVYFCPSLLLLGAGKQRECERHDPAQAPQGDRLLQGERGGDRKDRGMGQQLPPEDTGVHEQRDHVPAVPAGAGDRGVRKDRLGDNR